MKTIGITGGTGFIGGHLTRLLVNKGYDVVIFSRNKETKSKDAHISYTLWDAEKSIADKYMLPKLDAVINLAGAGIADKRWTEKRKQEIVDSRVIGTNFLVEKLKAHAPNCKTLISASATGFYGHDEPGRIPFKENAHPANDFLGKTCQLWEQAAEKYSATGRTVILRFGVVLGKESGAFPKFAQPMSLGVMPILGGGRQVISWIEVDDLARMIVYALETDSLSGIYNAVAPNPVSNKKLMKTIAAIKGGIKIPVPVPAVFLKILLGEMSEEVLKSCTASAQKIEQAGFAFNYPDITSATKAILNKG